jgi:hypothetical protein
MVLIFNKFDLNRAARDTNVNDITAHDVVVDSSVYGQTSLFHRSSVIMFHDLDTGNFKVLKHRHSDTTGVNNINKRNKGLVIDLITSH